MTAHADRPTAAPTPLLASDEHFNIRIVRTGNRWHAHITQGIAHLGEPGSSTYRTRSATRTVRKAMRTVSKIAADRHMTDVLVRVEYDQGGLRTP